MGRRLRRQALIQALRGAGGADQGVLALDAKSEPRKARSKAARAGSAVGHGIDLALAHAALLDELAPVPGVGHAPAPGGRLLAVPWPGSLDALDARHLRERSWIRAARIETRIEPSPRMQGCRSAL